MARFLAYVELAKLRIFELWLGAFVAYSLLDPSISNQPRSIAILALMLVALAMTAAVSLGLDDVAGLRDGVDLANHADTDRYGVNKPLLDGRLTEQMAMQFIYLLGAIGAVAMVAGLWLAWPVPYWLVALLGMVVFVAVNYSVGLKLSYHGGGELITFFAVAGTAFLPYAFVTGELTRPIVVESALVGFWMLQIAVFSNTQDREGDRAARRMTIAAMLSRRGNYGWILVVFACGWVVTGYGLVTHAIPGVLGVALVPTWLLQLRQLWIGVYREQWLKARLLGFWTFRLAMFSLVASNLYVLFRG